ncbi:MAG TPA: thioredoxin [Herpetosiphonaceae bacterium]
MATTASAIIDVSERDFATGVLQRSSSVPVVVDFWAAWCGPCRVLGPVLERLANEMGGAFILAKVDVDRNQRLAAQFGVQGIPAVKAFRDGKVVDEFTGALPESQVRAWLKKLVPSQFDQLVAAAQAQERADPDAAAALYRQALQIDPAHGKSLLGLGRILALQADPQAADVLQQIQAGLPEHAAAQAVLALAELLSAAESTPEAARQRLERNPNDSDARWTLAALAARSQQWEEACQQLLTLVQRDRAFRDDGARRVLLALFAALGEQDPLAVRYRRQLASVLFG